MIKKKSNELSASPSRMKRGGSIQSSDSRNATAVGVDQPA